MTEAVLFDVDGTLVDSNDGHARAWVAAFGEAGYAIPFARVRPLIGMGGDRILPLLVPGLTDDEGIGAAIAARRAAIFAERHLPNVQPFAGAHRLLAAVRERGARVVVATSAKRSELDALLERGDLGPLVDVASTSDDARTSKPAPDIVEAALAKAGIAPHAGVMVGDTRYDVDAAHRAGVACVALRCGGADPETLRDAEALYVDPAALAASLGTPPFAWATASSIAE